MTEPNLIVPSGMFAYSERVFTTTASACEAATGQQRLDYADGHWFFHMRSAKTGTLAKFMRSVEVYDKGELKFVRFVCREHGGLEAIIFND